MRPSTNPLKIISARVYLLCLFFIVQNTHAQTITTFAGTGKDGYSGDGGPATNAMLGQCISLAIDDKEDVYIATDFTIRKVNKHGIITTVAGNGKSGANGDGGPATNATFANITGIAFAPDGRLFLADRFSNKVRVINRKGIVTTYAGNGTYTSSGDGGPVENATFAWPSNVHFDKSGNLYIVDEGGGRIRMVNKDGIINTIATFNVPCDIAFDQQGRMYVTEFYLKHVRRIDEKTGISTYAGSGIKGFADGPASNATFGNLWGITTDNKGNLYIADQDNNAVRKVDKYGMVSTIAGNGKEGYSGDGGRAINASLRGCNDVAVDKQGNVYIADMKNFVVRKVKMSKKQENVDEITSVVPDIGLTTRNTENDRKANIIMDVTQNIVTVICQSANYEVLITDISGNELLSETFSSSTKVISLNDYPSGMYYIRVNKGRVYLIVKQ